MIGADELLTRATRELAEKDRRIEQLEASRRYDSEAIRLLIQKNEQLEAEVRALTEGLASRQHKHMQSLDRITELEAEVRALREQIERHVELCGYPFTE